MMFRPVSPEAPPTATLSLVDMVRKVWVSLKIIAITTSVTTMVIYTKEQGGFIYQVFNEAGGLQADLRRTCGLLRATYSWD